MITSQDQIQRLNEAAEKLAAADADFRAICREIADGGEPAPVAAKTRALWGSRKAAQAAATTGEKPKRRACIGKCPDCGVVTGVEWAGDVKHLKPHNAPDGVPCQCRRPEK